MGREQSGLCSQVVFNCRGIYVLISSFKFQSYLTDVNVDKYRIALYRIRVSAHRLQVEAGRWHKPVAIPYTERKCHLCNVLEDEYHFVLECTLYAEIRRTYIDKIYYLRPTVVTFVELLTSHNSNVNRKLAMYVFKAIDVRKTYYTYYG